MCARCDELEEENAWLKAELGMAVENTEVEKVRRAWRLSYNEAWIVVRLNRAGGKVVSYQQLLEELPSPLGIGDDRLKSNITTVVCRIRAKTDRNSIETARTAGMRLGPWLAERLPQVLSA